jgi:hypothetical protein
LGQRCCMSWAGLCMSKARALHATLATHVCDRDPCEGVELMCGIVGRLLLAAGGVGGWALLAQINMTTAFRSSGVSVKAGCGAEMWGCAEV